MLKHRQTIVRCYVLTILASILIQFSTPEADESSVIDAIDKNREALSYCNITLFTDSIIQTHERNNMSSNWNYYWEASLSEGYYSPIMEKKIYFNSSDINSDTFNATDGLHDRTQDQLVCNFIENQTYTANKTKLDTLNAEVKEDAVLNNGDNVSNVTKVNTDDTIEENESEGKDETIIENEIKQETKEIKDGTQDSSVTSFVEDDDEEEGVNRVIVDYASKSAGALILEKSPNFKGTSNLLHGDIDKYAISPCNEEKKYVVIGLSEDILVKQIVLINYERYSSHVKEFQILGSQSYPNKGTDWSMLGTFEASVGNGKQVFELEAPAWARYLKFKFLTHYGDEFYCTISQIQVHGSTMLQGFHEQWSEEQLLNAKEDGNRTSDESPDETTTEQMADQASHTDTASTTTTDTQVENPQVPTSLEQQQQVSLSTDQLKNETSATKETSNESTEDQKVIIPDTTTTDNDTKTNRTASDSTSNNAPQSTQESTPEADRVISSEVVQDNPTTEIKLPPSDETTTTQEQPQPPIADEPIRHEEVISTEQPPNQSKPTTRIPPKLLTKLIRLIPSASCLESLYYPPQHFKSILESTKTQPPSNTPSSPPHTIKMEPIFKTLTDEIKSLKMNQSIQEQYLDSLVSCYNKVLVDLVLMQNQEERIERLEEIVRGLMQPTSRFGSLLDVLKSFIKNLTPWFSYLKVQFHHLHSYFSILLIWVYNYVWIEKLSPLLNSVILRLNPYMKDIWIDILNFVHNYNWYQADIIPEEIVAIVYKHHTVVYFAIGTLFILVVVAILSNSESEEHDTETIQVNECVTTNDDQIANENEQKIIETPPLLEESNMQKPCDEVGSNISIVEDEPPPRIKTVDNDYNYQPVSPSCSPIRLFKENNDYNLTSSFHSVVKSHKIATGTVKSNEKSPNPNKILRNISTKIKKKKSNAHQVVPDDERSKEDQSLSDSHGLKSLGSMSVSSTVTSNNIKKYQLLRHKNNSVVEYWKTKVKVGNTSKNTSISYSQKSLNKKMQDEIVKSNTQLGTMFSTLSDNSIHTHYSD